jgi:acyl-CoA thioester hydrolase
MSVQVRIYYEDTDAGGVVYHANYLGYLERGRTEFLRERGVSVRQLADEGQIFPVVRLEIDFRSPALLDDLLRVETEVVKVGKTSFTLRQKVIHSSDDRTLVEALVTLVCVRPGMKPRRLPEVLLLALDPARSREG